MDTRLVSSYFVEGEYLGDMESEPYDGWPYLQANDLWYCEACGEVYARVVHKARLSDGQYLSAVLWEPTRGCCRRCRVTLDHLIPGSVIYSWHDLTIIDRMPVALLRWEAERLLDQTERELNHGKAQEALQAPQGAGTPQEPVGGQAAPAAVSPNAERWL